MQSVMEISSGSGRGYWPDALQEGFALNQTTSQCCRCCCLQPNIDWRIYSYKVRSSWYCSKLYEDFKLIHESMFLRRKVLLILKKLFVARLYGQFTRTHLTVAGE